MFRTIDLCTKDIPYGLVVTRGVATMAGVATPTIDMLIEWAQKNMGKEYLVDREFVGRDIKDTSAPQAFGLYSPQDLCMEGESTLLHRQD